MKKFYIFYLRTDLGFELYAYTDEKDIRNEFLRTRNMDLFLYKKIKLDTADMNDMYRDYQNAKLQWNQFATKNDDTMQIEQYKIVTTIEEAISSDNYGASIIGEYLYEFLHVEPKIFKRKYQDALKDIGYTTLHIAELNSELPFEVCSDVLGCFIFLFGYLMKGGKVK